VNDAMTEQQKQNEPTLVPTILLEIAPEDASDADAAVIGEVGRSMLADLTREGYRVEPVATGQRGVLELVYEVMQTVSVYAGDAWQHKDILDTVSSIYTLFVAASPIAVRLLHRKETHTTPAMPQASDPEVKVSIKVDGAEIEVTSRDVENDERVRQLAERFLAAHPSIKMTPQSKVSVKGRVRTPKKRRRY
jgi:hypothetical protein